MLEDQKNVVEFPVRQYVPGPAPISVEEAALLGCVPTAPVMVMPKLSIEDRLAIREQQYKISDIEVQYRSMSAKAQQDFQSILQTIFSKYIMDGSKYSINTNSLEFQLIVK